MEFRSSPIVRKINHAIAGLNARERLIVGTAVVCLIIFGIYQGAVAVETHIEESKRLLVVRKTQLQDIGAILKRYIALRQRRESLQTTFEKSQMTFEQVSAEVDKIVKDAISSDNYDLKKPHPPTTFGFEYEKQEFSLTVKSLTLEQLVKLLYQIEHGGRPIFLSKVDINKSLSGTDFSAVFEIYSISKAAPGAARSSES